MHDITWALALISLIGTIFNIKKNVVCFYVWMIGDVLWFIFDVFKGSNGRASLDLLQIILAFWGIISWNKNVD